MKFPPSLYFIREYLDLLLHHLHMVLEGHPTVVFPQLKSYFPVGFVVVARM